MIRTKCKVCGHIFSEMVLRKYVKDHMYNCARIRVEIKE